MIRFILMVAFIYWGLGKLMDKVHPINYYTEIKNALKFLEETFPENKNLFNEIAKTIDKLSKENDNTKESSAHKKEKKD